MRVLIIMIMAAVVIEPGCTGTGSNDLQPGIWRATLEIPSGGLPFNFELSEDLSSLQIINGAERITVNNIRHEGDSLFIRLPVFDSEIKASLSDGKRLTGHWYDYNRKDNYSIRFQAESGLAHRFRKVSRDGQPTTETWEVTFSPGTEDWYKAKGVFTLDGDYAEGTFVTETGDYRFLEGTMVDDSLWLSCFDGSHAFLFKALREGKRMEGTFWSGTHYQEPWIGVRNDSFELRDPDSLTYLNPGYDRFEFSFPDPDSNLVSLEDFKGQVVIAQVLGTWCPNCMDESAFYASAWESYHDQGLEIVGLAFEKTPSFKTAADRVRRMKSDLNIPYPILVAGQLNREEVAQKLPALNHIMSYPTSIYIDRSGKVRRVHTGFNGPATGDAFEVYKDRFYSLIETLVSEQQEAL